MIFRNLVTVWLRFFVTASSPGDDLSLKSVTWWRNYLDKSSPERNLIVTWLRKNVTWSYPPGRVWNFLVSGAWSPSLSSRNGKESLEGFETHSRLFLRFFFKSCRNGKESLEGFETLNKPVLFHKISLCKNEKESLVRFPLSFKGTAANSSCSLEWNSSYICQASFARFVGSLFRNFLKKEAILGSTRYSSW